MPIQDFGTGEGPSPLSRDPNTPQGTVGDRSGHGRCGVSGCEKSDSAQCRSRKAIPWKMKQGAIEKRFWWLKLQNSSEMIVQVVHLDPFESDIFSGIGGKVNADSLCLPLCGPYST